MVTCGPELFETVQQYLAHLPASSFRARLKKLNAATQLSVAPTSTACCEFTLELGNGGQSTFGFYSSIFTFDDLDPASFAPMSLIESVVAGRVRVKRWTFGFLQPKAVGEIRLSSGECLTSTRYGVPIPLMFCRLREVQYAPYTVVGNG